MEETTPPKLNLFHCSGCFTKIYHDDSKRRKFCGRCSNGIIMNRVYKVGNKSLFIAKSISEEFGYLSYKWVNDDHIISDTVLCENYMEFLTLEKKELVLKWCTKCNQLKDKELFRNEENAKYFRICRKHSSSEMNFNKWFPKN